MSDFASRLLKARAEAGMTQRELSEKTGISTVQLSRYEAGKSNPRLPLLFKLADALGVNPQWLNGSESHERDDAYLVKMDMPDAEMEQLIKFSTDSGVPMNVCMRLALAIWIYRTAKRRGVEEIASEFALEIDRLRREINKSSSLPLPPPLDPGNEKVTGPSPAARSWSSLLSDLSDDE